MIPMRCDIETKFDKLSVVGFEDAVTPRVSCLPVMGRFLCSPRVDGGC